MLVSREEIRELEMVPEVGVLAVGLKYKAECGCVVRIGMFVRPSEEMAATYQPCSTHTPHAAEFMERFPGPDGPEIPTEVWIGQLLDEIRMVI